MLGLLKKIKKKFIRIPNAYMKFCKEPIKENLILLEAGQGKNINGNMFAILKEICTNEEWRELVPVFVVTAEMERGAKERLTFYQFNVRIVIRNTKEYCYNLATAKYLLTDNSFPPFFNKREGQVYLNTWHGTPLKKMGRSDINNAPSLSNIQKNYLMTDFALFPNTFTRDVFMKDYMLENIYKGKVVLCDYPRNSIFMKKSLNEKLRESLGLEEKQIIGYLPTWRGTNRKKDIEIQKKRLHENLLQIDAQLNDNQIFYVNLHFILGNLMDYNKYRHIRPFPSEYETYDFLAICDILVTDYSSVFFDFASTEKKIILFPYDLEEYMQERGTYFPITDLPFPIAYNVSDLITELNNNEEIEGYDDFLEEYCSYRDLNAPRKILELMVQKKCDEIVIESGPDNGKELNLIYVGELRNKKQNRKILEYLKSLDVNNCNILLCFRSKITPQVIDFLMELPENINYLALVVQIDLSISDRILAILSMRSILCSEVLEKKLKESFKREKNRLIFGIEPSKTVFYAGNSNYMFKILGCFSGKKEGYIQQKVFDGCAVYSRPYKVKKYYFNHYYDKVYDTGDEDAFQYCSEEEKEEYYNTCFQMSNIFCHFHNSTDYVGVSALALVRSSLPGKLDQLEFRLGDFKIENAYIRNGVKIGSGFILTCYSLKIPFESMKTLDIHSKVNVIYKDCNGFGMKRGVRYCFLDFKKGKGRKGAIKLFEETNTSAYFRQSVGNYMYFTVRNRNLTDSRLEQIKLYFAFYAAKLMPRKKILILFEKNSSRYEESASVLYEKLLDRGYRNAYFIIDRKYSYIDSISEKYRSNLIYKGTFRHYLYFFKATIFLGSETLVHAIDLRIANKYVTKKMNSKDLTYVFLQHGVMYMVSLDAETRDFFGANGELAKYRVVTSSQKEADHFIELGNYDPSCLYICGLPKYDKNQWNADADKIVIMPTWRSWEFNDVRFDFKDSKYYQMITRIFQAIPEEYHEKVIILPHPLFFDAVKEAEFDLKKYFDGNTKYDEILRNTKVLITDYSSIAYDAFYRGANVIFYWEEKEECLKNYGPSAKLMLNETNVYGDVCYRKEDLEKVIVRNYLEGQTAQHRENYQQIVEFHDGKNTERLIDMLKRDKII